MFLPIIFILTLSISDLSHRNVLTELGSGLEVSDIITALYMEHVDTLIEHLETTSKSNFVLIVIPTGRIVDSLC